MQWSNIPEVGFTDPGVETWLPINNNYDIVNVDDEMGDPDSHYNLYKNVMELRKTEPTFELGVTITNSQGNVLIIGRVQNENFYPVYVTILNMDPVEAEINISGLFHPSHEVGIVLISSTGSSGSHPPG